MVKTFEMMLETVPSDSLPAEKDQGLTRSLSLPVSDSDLKPLALPAADGALDSMD